MAQKHENLRSVLEIKFTSVEKRRNPSKHYVFVIHVTYTDHTTAVVYRRYSQFFDFQNIVLDSFPDEAGTTDPTDRVIPFLPGKILVGRSHVRDVAISRLPTLEDYCKKLIRLPTKVSESKIVLGFFQPSIEDLTRIGSNDDDNESSNKRSVIMHITDPQLCEEYISIADYHTSDRRNEVALKKGEKVNVLDKNENGWWFINTDTEQGWVPGNFLEKVDGSREVPQVFQPGFGEKYVAIQGHTPQERDEMALSVGQVVEVLEKNLLGWWLARYDDKQGMVPAAFLQKADEQQEKIIRHHPVQLVGNVMEVRQASNGSSGNLMPQQPKQHEEQHVDEQHHHEQQQYSNGNVVGVRTSSHQHHQRRHHRQYYHNNNLHHNGNNNHHLEASDTGYHSDPNAPTNSLSVQHKPPPPRQGKPKRPPPPVLKRTDSVEEKITNYVTIADFKEGMSDGLDFTKGETVEVIQKHPSGWWFVRIHNEEGWVPASYLHPVGSPPPFPPPPSPPHARRGSGGSGGSRGESQHVYQAFRVGSTQQKMDNSSNGGGMRRSREGEVDDGRSGREVARLEDVEHYLKQLPSRPGATCKLVVRTRSKSLDRKRAVTVKQKSKYEKRGDGGEEEIPRSLVSLAALDLLMTPSKVLTVERTTKLSDGPTNTRVTRTDTVPLSSEDARYLQFLQECKKRGVKVPLDGMGSGTDRPAIAYHQHNQDIVAGGGHSNSYTSGHGVSQQHVDSKGSNGYYYSQSTIPSSPPRPPRPSKRIHAPARS